MNPFVLWLLHLSLPFVGNRLKAGWIVNIVCMVLFLSLGMSSALVLNVAGPRESKSSGIQAKTKAFLSEVLGGVR